MKKTLVLLMLVIVPMLGLSACGSAGEVTIVKPEPGYAFVQEGGKTWSLQELVVHSTFTEPVTIHTSVDGTPMQDCWLPPGVTTKCIDVVVEGQGAHNVHISYTDVEGKVVERTVPIIWETTSTVETRNANSKAWTYGLMALLVIGVLILGVFFIRPQVGIATHYSMYGSANKPDVAIGISTGNGDVASTAVLSMREYAENEQQRALRDPRILRIASAMNLPAAEQAALPEQTQVDA